MKREIKDAIVKFKLRKRANIRSRLLLKDPTRKKFWRFLKSQIKVAGRITAAYNADGQMVFEQHEIEESVPSHFSKIFHASNSEPNQDPNSSCHEVQEAIDQLDEMMGSISRPEVESDKYEKIVCSPYTFSELDQILKELPNGKSSGCDTVPNELLKNSGLKFKSYLLIFLNRIMDEGLVPEELNKGKCILIHKVSNQ